MHSILISSILAVITLVSSEYGSEKTDHHYDSNPWRPVLGPYGDRVKPLKVNPKYEDKYLMHSVAGKPYGAPYVSGIYTYPYYAYGETSPVYQPVLNPYPSYYGNYYIRKESTGKPYVPYYKN